MIISIPGSSAMTCFKSRSSLNIDVIPKKLEKDGPFFELPGSDDLTGAVVMRLISRAITAMMIITIDA